MTPNELYDLIDTKNPARIRPYKVIDDTIELRCPKCKKWKCSDRFSNDNARHRTIAKRPECMNCQSDDRLRYLKRKKNENKNHVITTVS